MCLIAIYFRSGEIEVVAVVVVIVIIVVFIVDSRPTATHDAMDRWSILERSISLLSRRREVEDSRTGIETEGLIGAWPFLSPLIYERRQRAEIELERPRRRGTFNYGTPAGCAAEIGELSDSFAGRHTISQRIRRAITDRRRTFIKAVHKRFYRHVKIVSYYDTILYSACCHSMQFACLD